MKRICVVVWEVKTVSYVLCSCAIAWEIMVEQRAFKYRYEGANHIGEQEVICLIDLS